MIDFIITGIITVPFILGFIYGVSLIGFTKMVLVSLFSGIAFILILCILAAVEHITDRPRR